MKWTTRKYPWITKKGKSGVRLVFAATGSLQDAAESVSIDIGSYDSDKSSHTVRK